MGYTFRARRVGKPEVTDLRSAPITAAEDTGKNTVDEAAEAVANRDEPRSFSGMTKPELIETANAQNIETEGLTKAEIIERLQS